MSEDRPRGEMQNRDVARVLDDIGDVLEIAEANVFRVRAHRLAAQTVKGLGRPLAALDEDEPLESLPHIGSGIAAKIREMLSTGRCAEHRELLDSPEGRLLDIVKLPGVGPKRARQLQAALEIESIDDLADAAEAGLVATVPGFGAKTEAKILRAIKRRGAARGRHRLDIGRDRAAALIGALEGLPAVRRADVAGSVRRSCETIGDLDLLVTCDDPDAVMQELANHPSVEEVLSAGHTKGRIRLTTGLEADVRIVPEASFGAAMLYFTGSKEHNIELRERGVRRGLKINEYGVFPADDDTADSLAGASEEEIYELLELAWIPPELREGRGEIARAAAGNLPDLVELADIRGDCHVHSTWSDGRRSIQDMVAAALDRGYEYLAITDHSQRVSMAGGLDADRLREQWSEIDAINAAIDGFRVLKGVEVDILADGSLDLPDECLAEADLVIAAVHFDQNMPAAEMTPRILRALENHHVHALAHPTGRKLLRREPFDFDIVRVIEAAAEAGVWLECNASPTRLDLGDLGLRVAKQAGARILVSTDAHDAPALGWMDLGVATARRGWLTTDDIANTKPIDELLDARRAS